MSAPPPAPLTVHLHPSPDRDTVNPYLSLLVGGLRERGVRVVPLTWRRALRERGPAVVHVHWPEMPLHDPLLRRALLRSARLAAGLLAARLRGLPVVWTVHNLRAHDGHRPVLQRLLWAVFPRLVGGWISLSAAGAESAQRAFRPLRRRPHRVLAHGTYAQVVGRPDRRRSREALGLAPDAAVVAMVGRVKPYKGVEDLVEAVHASPAPDLRLVVGGGCEDDALRERLEAVAERDPRVSLLLQRLPQQRVDEVLAAADLLVLPFRSVLNSGSVLLCLSAGRPVLAPRTAVFEELAAEVGPGWLRLFDGPLTASVLEAALAQGPARGEPDLSRHAWDRVAAEHAGFYEQVLPGRRRRLRRTRPDVTGVTGAAGGAGAPR
ncbi:glycosyltransferase family 4 protein, partial [Kineococcus indalonis]|uniref:glycosyltransferase family 4 protein n=1 Tax=Kineococcus indalonis TaxID=2696566 RepID=UPI001412D2D3